MGDHGRVNAWAVKPQKLRNVFRSDPSRVRARSWAFFPFALSPCTSLVSHPGIPLDAFGGSGEVLGMFLGFTL